MATGDFPMFPLENPLLPGEAMPLRIFEPRYLRMVTDLRRSEPADRELGVVLISRGREVGGGDQRHDIGCVASVLIGEPIDDRSLAITVVGRTPLSVTGWQGDDPYPLAAIEVRNEPRVDGPEHWHRVAATSRLVEEIHELLARLGAEVHGIDRRLPDDGVSAVWRLATLLPLGPYDRQRLLECPTAAERLVLIDSLASDLRRDLELRFSAPS